MSCRQELVESVMQKISYDLIIIGGGAAGLMAGVYAVRSGLKVVIIERLAQAGRKLVVTGGGRCNFTRDLPCAELLDAYYGRKNFVRPAIYNFPPVTVIDFFAEIGLKSVCEPSGGVYPASQKAQDVLRVLEEAYRDSGGDFILAETVAEILLAGAGVQGVSAGGREYFARSVLLAAGGCSMEELGSDGSGFTLAREAGHRIIQPVPGLVGLVVPEMSGNALAGLSLPVVIRYGEGKKAAVFSGDMLFTHRGLSGPAVLDVSRDVCRDLAQGRESSVRVCWGDYTAEFWDKLVSAQRRENGRQRIYTLLAGYYPRRFVEYILQQAGIAGDMILAVFPKESYRRLRDLLVESRFTVSRSEGFSRAMVTAGGVYTAEVKPKTLESRIVKGLYFAGEVLDVDGRCGGYNLQWAFASGRLAAESIGRR